MRKGRKSKTHRKEKKLGKKEMNSDISVISVWIQPI